MCNLYTYKMTVEEMRALKLHFQLIGTTWSDWEERQRRRNAPIEDVYPNKRAPVVVLQDGAHVVREDMLWGFPKFEGKGPYVTNFRHLKSCRFSSPESGARGPATAEPRRCRTLATITSSRS